jgi:hypothetical protein
MKLIPQGQSLAVKPPLYGKIGYKIVFYDACSCKTLRKGEKIIFSFRLNAPIDAGNRVNKSFSELLSFCDFCGFNYLFCFNLVK